MTIHTLTPDMGLSKIHETIRRANSGDTILVPAHEVDLVRRALRHVAPSKTLTVKAIAAAAATGE